MQPNDPALDPTDAAAGAPAPVASSPLVTVPLDPEALIKWKGDLDRANRRRQIFEPAWERNLKAYTPDPTNDRWGDEVNPGIDFYQVEQKKAQLFFETPTVILTPEPDTDPTILPQIAARQVALNRKLGPHGLDTKRLMDQVLFSLLCPAGMGCSKLGVTRITQDVPVPHPTDPTQPHLDATGQPITAPVPVYQQIFWEAFSAKKILIPTNFHSTEFDKAPWLGVKFTLPKRLAIREFQLPPDFAPAAKAPSDQVYTLPGVKDADTDADQVTGVEVWYKAAHYDDAIYHPEWLRQLVFLDGQDDPVVHRDSPYQTFQHGAFTPDSLIGHPIHITTVRDLADSAYVPSDCTVTRPLVNEIARFRTQLVEQRESSTSVRICDEAVITPEILSKIVRSPWGSILPIAGFDANRMPIAELTKSTYPRENWQAQTVIETDLAKVNTLAANQVGTQQDTVRSATELTYVERNANVRMQAEVNRVVASFLAGVAKLDALMKRFETPPGQAPLAGYTYDIKPDSGKHVDAADDRRYFTEVYNMLAKDPNVNRMALLKAMLPLLRLDPTQLIVQPPPPGPEPPSTSFIVKGEDLSPLQPQYANIAEVLNQIGVHVTQVPITPTMVQNAALASPIKPRPVAHGGTPEGPDLVSKHTADTSGTIANFGGQAA